MTTINIEEISIDSGFTIAKYSLYNHIFFIITNIVYLYVHIYIFIHMQHTSSFKMRNTGNDD